MTTPDKDNIHIDRALALFGSTEDVLAAVLYEGALNGAEPVEAHIDLGRQTLSMVFNAGNGRVEKVIAGLSDENIAVVRAAQSNGGITSAFNQNSVPGRVGFYQVDAAGTLVRDALWRVPVLVME